MTLSKYIHVGYYYWGKIPSGVINKIIDLVVISPARPRRCNAHWKVCSMARFSFILYLTFVHGLAHMLLQITFLAHAACSPTIDPPVTLSVRHEDSFCTDTCIRSIHWVIAVGCTDIVCSDNTEY